MEFQPYLVVLQAGELLKDVRRLNVSITRARHKLILIGDLGTLRQYNPLEKLINMMTANQQVVYIITYTTQHVVYIITYTNQQVANMITYTNQQVVYIITYTNQQVVYIITYTNQQVVYIITYTNQQVANMIRYTNQQDNFYTQPL